jgi:hypothetical protein
MKGKGKTLGETLGETLGKNVSLSSLQTYKVEKNLIGLVEKNAANIPKPYRFFSNL